MRGGSEQGAPPALAEVRDRGLSSGVCSICCPFPIPAGRRHRGRAPPAQGVLEVLVGVWAPRYCDSRVLGGSGLPALSLSLSGQDPLPTLLQETRVGGQSLACTKKPLAIKAIKPWQVLMNLLPSHGVGQQVWRKRAGCPPGVLGRGDVLCLAEVPWSIS